MPAMRMKVVMYERPPTGRNRLASAASPKPTTMATRCLSHDDLMGSSVDMTSQSGTASRTDLLIRRGVMLLTPAEEALWAHQKHQHHDQERYAVTVGGVDERAAHLPHDADDERTREGAVGVAEGAQDHRGEERQQQPPAHLRAQLHVQPVEHAPRSEERRVGKECR